MDISIFVDFEDDKVVFSPNLANEFLCENDDILDLNDSTTIEFNNSEVDFKILNDKLMEFVNKAKNFTQDNINKQINFNYIINQSFYSDKNQNIALNFIKQHKELNVTLVANDYKSLIDSLKDGKYPNLKINFKNSNEEVPYYEFYKMWDKLNGIIDFIEYYNLSNLEKCILAYDIVKANKYNHEDDTDNYGISRNLNEIINSDKIVCAGFSNLLSFILTNLNIKNDSVILQYSDKKTLHQRNYIYLKDEKYNIDGVFFMDATWDSKKDDNYINNYMFFLRTFDFFKFNENESVKSPEKLFLLSMSLEEFKDSLKNPNHEDILRSLLRLNSLAAFCESEMEIPKLLNIVDDEKTIDDFFNTTKAVYKKQISKETFINALYKVKRIEYINGIIKTEPNEKYISDIASKHFGNAEDRLLKVLGIYKPPTFDKTLKEINSDSIEQDNLRMKLLRDLKNNIGDLPTNDYIKKM